MRVDIQPQWKKLANWYWGNLTPTGNGGGRSIWEMLEHDYGAVRLYHDIDPTHHMIVKFPDEKMYTAFLLRWA